jgi:hypothetical protein
MRCWLILKVKIYDLAFYWFLGGDWTYVAF